MLGRHHTLLRTVRALRRDAALRRSRGLFLAEGLHLAREAVDAGAPIEAVIVSPRLTALVEGRALLDALARGGVPCHETDDATLAAVQDARSPQPVTCLVRRVERSLEQVDAALAEAALVAVFEEIQDPGNLGTLVRTADAAGCDLCCVTGRSADPFHPRAVRATMGSIFRLPPHEEPVVELLGRLRRHGLRLVGADPRGGRPFDRADLTGRLALVLGGEGGGLGPTVRAALDERVSIPMRSGVESLSVGAAAAVLLFEAARQRRP